MNIFGKAFGGLLVLISLGWLATIVGIRPGGVSNNQISSDPTATNPTSKTGAAPAKATSGAAPATTSKAKTSTFSAGATGAATPATPATVKPEVEKNPRDAANPGKADPVKATTPPTAPAASPPVAAGW